MVRIQLSATRDGSKTCLSAEFIAMSKTLDPRDRDKIVDVFWARVSKPEDDDGCWDWTGTTINGEYGAYAFRLSSTRKTVVWLAHRLAWTLLNGPLEDHVVLDHQCGNKKCVRPQHLKAATNTENAGREYRRPAQCQTEGCANPSDRGRGGLCVSCYRRAKKSKKPSDSRTRPGRPSDAVPGGASPPQARLPAKSASPEQLSLPVHLNSRLRARTELDPETGCVLWTGEQNNKGYGRIEMRIGGVRRRYLVHRLAWQLNVGDIPPGWVIDHLCHRKTCINVEHLACVPHGQNSRRAGEMAKPPRSLKTPGPSH